MHLAGRKESFGARRYAANAKQNHSNSRLYC